MSFVELDHVDGLHARLQGESWRPLVIGKIFVP